MLITNKLNPRCEIFCEKLFFLLIKSLKIFINKYKAPTIKVDNNKSSIDELTTIKKVKAP